MVNALLTDYPPMVATIPPHLVFLTPAKRTPPLPCITVPLNLLETGGTRRAAFDFQSRPVGHNRDSDSV